MSSSVVLEMALVTWNLEDAGEVKAYRVLRIGMREVTPSPTKTESNILLEESLEPNDLETAANVLVGSANSFAEITKMPSISWVMSEPSPNSIAQFRSTV